MPRLSDTMTEGTLARWLKKPGDQVQQGEIVAEIETDKATMELEAYDSGVLEKVLVEEGQTVPIGQAIAVVGTGDGAAAPAETARGDATGRPPAGEGVEAPPTGTVSPAEPGAETTPKPAAEETGDVSGEARPAGGPTPAEQPAQPPQPAAERQPAPAQPAEDGQDQVKASPMARAIARERGIDLHTIRGSGPGGRIIRADVESAGAGDGRAQQPATPPTAPAPAPSAAPRPSSDDVEEIPLTNMRRIVARRMVESVQSAPHFYLTSVVDADALMKFRAELNERLAAGGEAVKLSVNDLLVKACAVALRANPDVNVSFAGDKILRHKRVHVGIAVAIEGGLIVPVVRDADRKSLGEVAREAHGLVDKARAGKLTPDEFTGGTFTISNLGMFGIDHFTAIINSPEAAILAVGATAPEPAVRDGQVIVRQTMKLTLSIDHRVLDGATAARFLQQLKAILEEPLRIVV